VVHNQVESTLCGERFKLLRFVLAAVLRRLGLPDRAKRKIAPPISH